MFHYLVPETFEQHLHVLLIFLSTSSVPCRIFECDISNHQSHTIGDAVFGCRINLKQ